MKTQSQLETLNGYSYPQGNGHTYSLQDAEIILPGTKELAQQVATEVQAVYGLSYSPALADIMDAIARGLDINQE